MIALQKKEHISHSQIRNGRCLLKYKLINLLGEIKEENNAMKLGSVVHIIAHDYVKSCVENSYDADFDLMNKLVDKYFNDSGLPEDFYISLRDAMIIFAERGVDFNSILDFEKEFLVDINSPDGSKSDNPVMVKGIIDRVNCYRVDDGSVIEFIDYKHQSKISTEEDVNNDLQLSIYKTIGCNYLYTGYDYVRHGIFHTKYNFIRWSELKKVSECGAEFENIENFLRRQWERLINTPDDQYEPTKGETCWEYGGCPVMAADKCPLYTKVEVEKMKQGSIDEKVRALRSIDIQRDIMLSQVKTYFKENSAMTIDGGPVGYYPTSSYKYKLEPFRNFAINIQADITGLTISKRDAEKVIKKIIDPDDLSEAEQLELDAMKIDTAKNTFKY